MPSQPGVPYHELTKGYAVEDAGQPAAFHLPAADPLTTAAHLQATGFRSMPAFNPAGIGDA